MILIADSGSTKTDWALLTPEDSTLKIRTSGINAIQMSAEEITRIIRDELLRDLFNEGIPQEAIEEIYFYGAGCTPEAAPKVQRVLKSLFSLATTTEVNGDLLAAARATLGNQPGIACILGTGSNSGVYDGTRIVQNTPPLGYILGDEGSGATLGKLFLNALFKGFLPEALKQTFLEETDTTYAAIIHRVYREPQANRFLASLSPFIARHMKEYPQLEQLVDENFREFIRRNLLDYYHENPSTVGSAEFPHIATAVTRESLPIGIVGSIAWFYREELSKVFAADHLPHPTILKAPLEKLAEYHKEDPSQA